MTLTIKYTNAFKKDLKKLKKQNKDLNKLVEIVKKISIQVPLDVKNRDHQLVGELSEFRECHIEPDWLLIYHVDNGILVLTLTRTGSHSDLFDK